MQTQLPAARCCEAQSAHHLCLVLHLLSLCFESQNCPVMVCDRGPVGIRQQTEPRAVSAGALCCRGLRGCLPCMSIRICSSTTLHLELLFLEGARRLPILLESGTVLLESGTVPVNDEQAEELAKWTIRSSLHQFDDDDNDGKPTAQCWGDTMFPHFPTTLTQHVTNSNSDVFQARHAPRTYRECSCQHADLFSRPSLCMVDLPRLSSPMPLPLL